MPIAPPSGRRFASVLLLLVVLVSLAKRAHAADPVDVKAVPDSLRPWVAWALDGKEDASCPSFFGRADTVRCVWPSRLQLDLDDHGGRFVERWHADVKRWVPLPGDDKRWPLAVKVDGARTVVTTQDGVPSVQLGAGDHDVAGSFLWDSLPESLRVPPETGLLALRLRGATVTFPERDEHGTVWLQRTASPEEGDALEFVVHRKLTDEIPFLLTTRVEMHVAGKAREVLLGKALPPGFVPMSLESPIVARVEPDGRIRVQVRAGTFTLVLTARSGGVVQSLTRPPPDGPWRDGDEVWVFEARNALRVVTVEGVASIDPQQTTLPDEWKRLPAYPMKVGATLTFTERRRGDADPLPEQLSLVRSFWLDFDGAGYSVNDKLTGQLNQDSRLAMAAPTVLGRVSIGGRDQFITHLENDPRTGVEVRQGELLATADSRILGDPADIPAVSWAHDFHRVEGSMHLPPGWRLVYVSGVDEVPGTWLKHWSLLELFLALIVSIGVGRLYGVRWGAVALVTLVLTLPEEDAPKWSWLAVLAFEALLRVVPAGRVRRLFELARLGAILVVTLVTIPYLVQHVRTGLNTAMENESSVVGADDESAATGELEGKGEPKAGAPLPGTPAGGAAKDELKEAAALPLKRFQISSAGNAPASPSRDSMQSNSQVYDPTAAVQTGPGLPQWRWTTLELRWSGPVAATQRLHLFLLGPKTNLVLAFARALLLGFLVLRLWPRTDRFFPGRWTLAAAASFVLFGVPLRARADVPDSATHAQLAPRLTRPPACPPECASSERMALDVRANDLRARIAVGASAPTAFPLPGTLGEWTPTSVLLDGRPAKSLVRTSDGILWISLGAGDHEIVLDGAMPDRPSVQLSLHAKSHRVEVTRAGWSVAGVHENGLADEDLELSREQATVSPDKPIDPGVLPPFAEVERTLEAGLNWQLRTRVVRRTPPGTAIVLQIPLLPGESVTTADVRVESGKVLVDMGARATEMEWRSVLQQRSPIKFSAPASLAWIEVWKVDVGPIWHASFSGIPAVGVASPESARIPEWRPWPGEELAVDLVRPEGVGGQTLTIDRSETDVTPGLRATDVKLLLRIRSSRGGEHTIVLPPSAELESVAIDGAPASVRQQGANVTIPVVPGAQSIELSWRQTPGLTALFASPRVDLGAPSVNATTTISVPGSRWLLLLGGPPVGPAILFWSLLLILLVISLALGSIRWTPLRGAHWLLLSIGLSQVDEVAGAIFVGWLLALGYRARNRGESLGAVLFDLRQLLLAAWTLVALGILGVSLYQGLLGPPEMQVRGNGSSAELLRWYVDRSPAVLPSAWMVSVPIWFYRAAMLAWALWIALSLLRWLRWGWEAFTAGGTWKKPPRRPARMMVPPPPPPPIPHAPPT